MTIEYEILISDVLGNSSKTVQVLLHSTQNSLSLNNSNVMGFYTLFKIRNDILLTV